MAGLGWADCYYTTVGDAIHNRPQNAWHPLELAVFHSWFDHFLAQTSSCNMNMPFLLWGITASFRQTCISHSALRCIKLHSAGEYCCYLWLRAANLMFFFPSGKCSFYTVLSHEKKKKGITSLSVLAWFLNCSFRHFSSFKDSWWSQLLRILELVLNHATRLIHRSCFKKNCHLRINMHNISIHRFAFPLLFLFWCLQGEFRF